MTDELNGRAFPIGTKVRLTTNPSRPYVAEAGATAIITSEAFYLNSGRYVQRLKWQDELGFEQNDGAYCVVDFEEVPS